MTTSAEQNVVGIDVGGANLKYADSRGSAWSRSFPLWRLSDRLADAIAEDLVRFGPIDSLLATMTGELADCFVDRADGVKHIVSHVCRGARRAGARQVVFYAVDGRFRDGQSACRDSDLVAAANWHALASFVAAEVAADATLVDIGSTTTDIIPIRDGRVGAAALDDHGRLAEGSLVYVGCRRTPVCALVDQLELCGRAVPVMNEVFATIDDALIVLNAVAPDPDDSDTADGRPRTATCAANRLARMIGLDRRTVDSRAAAELAAQIAAAARLRIGQALARLASPGRPIVLSGHGSELLDLAAASLPLDQPILRLADHLGGQAARCAPCYAMARLFRGNSTDA